MSARATARRIAAMRRRRIKVLNRRHTRLTARAAADRAALTVALGATKTALVATQHKCTRAEQQLIALQRSNAAAAERRVHAEGLMAAALADAKAECATAAAREALARSAHAQTQVELVKMKRERRTMATQAGAHSGGYVQQLIDERNAAVKCARWAKGLAQSSLSRAHATEQLLREGGQSLARDGAAAERVPSTSCGTAGRLSCDGMSSCSAAHLEVCAMDTSPVQCSAMGSVERCTGSVTGVRATEVAEPNALHDQVSNGLATDTSSDGMLDAPTPTPTSRPMTRTNNVAQLADMVTKSGSGMGATSTCAGGEHAGASVGGRPVTVVPETVAPVTDVCDGWAGTEQCQRSYFRTVHNGQDWS